MKAEQKDKVVEQPRSIALTAHEAINAIRKDNYGDMNELISDMKDDMSRIEEMLEDG